MLAGSKLRTSFEPDSVMEFGFYNNIINCQTRPHNSDGQPLHICTINRTAKGLQQIKWLRLKIIRNTGDPYLV